MSIASWGLLTLQDAKDHLSVTEPEFDAVIEGMVESATILCENYTDRLLASRALVEIYDGNGRAELQLKQYPTTLANITEVAFLTSTMPDAWTAYDATTYGLYIADSIGSRIGWRGLRFPWGRQVVRVSYTAGYSTVPKAIKDACRVALKALWDVRDKQNASIASQTFPGGQSVTYDKAFLPEAFSALLDPYVRWTI